ncbi:SGNH/GDSL hydrolase family protein [Phycicoccus sp. CSK15P-2]|uniref:SGNH/GDSL hydrolase family protein n=1 Tax=Phycicoccus sp. CSK15P-2 TaxID=2807627 RepID=UPI0019504C7B|nr:SGNH/GDSL hydrolase family protein [Phycicoccus sp. CSK15P-2]MBM6403511.1 SGNH/GDSL hydrolase family protein [Phycicoccus sp. CSK15P-2]
MQRFRGTDVGLGLVVLAVNVGLVVGVVQLTSRTAETQAAPTPSISASPSPTPSPTPTPSPSSQEPALSAILASGDPVDITVLGDQTGDGSGEWVGVLAGLVAQDREVELSTLSESDPTVYDEPETIGSSGAKVSIHNGSRAGTKARYAASRIAFLVPEDSDLVIFSYGRNDTAKSVRSGLRQTADAVREQAPDARLALVLQPPVAGDDDRAVREAVADVGRSDGYDVLDVAEVFIGSGEPDAYVSSRDPSVMSTVGDDVWGSTVHALLTGESPPDLQQTATETPGTGTGTTDGGSTGTGSGGGSGSGGGGTGGGGGDTGGGGTGGGGGGGGGGGTDPDPDPTPTVEPTEDEPRPTQTPTLPRPTQTFTPRRLDG